MRSLHVDSVECKRSSFFIKTYLDVSFYHVSLGNYYTLSPPIRVTNEDEPNKDASTDENMTMRDGNPFDVAAPPSGILELDHVYEALGHSRRRYLCYTLLEDTAWTLNELARKIAAWENDVPNHDVTNHQQEKVYVSLYHAHIPKLVDDDVLTFDDATETVTPAANAEQVLIALEGMGASLDSNQESHARSEMDESRE